MDISAKLSYHKMHVLIRMPHRGDSDEYIQHTIIISASNLNREAVRRADALLKTNYVTSDACDHKRTGPTNAWVVRCLS